MRSTKTPRTHCLILAIALIALTSAVVFAAKPASPRPTTFFAPKAPTCTDLTEVTGTYQDGKGVYLANEAVDFSRNGDVRITPLSGDASKRGRPSSPASLHAVGVPLAINDVVITEPEAAVTVEVLRNDVGIEDTPIVVSIVTQPQAGSAFPSPDNSITYNPPPTAGPSTVSFVYAITDADGESSQATLTIRRGVLPTGFGVFGVKVFAEAGQSVEGGCERLAGTGDSPLGEELVGLTSGYAIANCGTFSAEGTVDLVPEESPFSLWRLTGTAIALGERAGAQVEVQFFDTFSVIAPELPIGTKAPLFFRVHAQGTIQGSSSAGAEYRLFLLKVFRKISPTAVEEVHASNQPILFAALDGIVDRIVDVHIPSARVGDELLLRTGFVYARAGSNLAGSGTTLKRASLTADFSLCSVAPTVEAIGASAARGKCGREAPDLQISALELRHQLFPTGAWISVPAQGTIDGNRVQVVATVENTGEEPETAGVDFIDPDTGDRLPGDGELVVITIPAGGSVEVSYAWDTHGFAWSDLGQPHSSRKAKVTVSTGDGFAELADAEVKAIRIVPKPVVLVHGFISSAATWDTWHAFLNSAHPEWRAYAVGDGIVPGGFVMDTGSATDWVTNSIKENAEIVGGYVHALRVLENAWHVDFVVHSMGGLISRQYIQDFMPDSSDDRPVVSHLVMLGTPNHGTPCAELAGITGPQPAVWQLRTDYVTDIFNSNVSNRRGVPFSIVAGIPLLYTCNKPWTGDTVVSADSATTGIDDSDVIDLIHTKMTASPEIFASFVKPRLALGPGTVAKAWSAAASSIGQDAPASPAMPPVLSQILLSGTITLPQAGSLDVAIPAPAGSRFGVTLLAPETVGSILLDPAGGVAAVIDAESDLAAQPFRTLVADSPPVGNWTLRLTQTAGVGVPVSVFAWVDGSPVVLALEVGPSVGGRVTITGKLSNADSPISGAVLTATVLGEGPTSATVDLHDDGQHEDAGSADGVYAARTERLPHGSYLVAVRADGPGFSRITSRTFEITEEQNALSPAAVWIGLANTDDDRIRFDLRAEVHRNATELIGSGELTSVPGDGAGFSNATLREIPLTLTAPPTVQPGDTLSITLLARNACAGSGKNSGRVRIWFGDAVAGSQFGATFDGDFRNYFLNHRFILTPAPGSGPMKSIDVHAGARCSDFKPFGTWTTTLD